MDFSAKITYALFIQFIHFFKLSSAHYCEWGTCVSFKQYCCGDNKCCNKTDVASYVEIGFGILFSLLVLCWIIYSLRRYSACTGPPIMHILFRNQIFSGRRESSTDNLTAYDVFDNEQPFDPPPPYSQVVQMRK